MNNRHSMEKFEFIFGMKVVQLKSIEIFILFSSFGICTSSESPGRDSF